MSPFEQYPKIRGLSKFEDILKEPVVIVTEKIDGKNMRVFIPAGVTTPADVIIGGRENDERDPTFGLRSEARSIRQIVNLSALIAHFGPSGKDVVLYGEFYGKGVQRRVDYRPDKGFALFDINVGGSFLTRKELEDVCQALGLEAVPLLYCGKPELVSFDRLVNIKSTTGKKHGVDADGNVTEGVVIKSDPLKKVVYEVEYVHDDHVICKYKSKGFEEDVPLVEVKKDLSSIDTYVDRYVVRVRVEKMIDKLKERSLYTGSMRDVKALGDAVISDVFLEEAKDLEALLQSDPTITRKAVSNRIVSKTAAIFKEILAGQ